MGLTKLIAIASLALAASIGSAADLVTLDKGDRFAALSLAVRAEKVVHNAEPYLLIRIWTRHPEPLDFSGRPIDWLTYEQTNGRAFLPVVIACDRVTIQARGKTFKPDAGSLCTTPATLTHPQSVPIFIAFKYPDERLPNGAAGSVQVTVPVTVLKPAAPVQTRLHPTPLPTSTHVNEALLGEHALSAEVFLQ
jgi:hypothetical protein